MSLFLLIHLRLEMIPRACRAGPPRHRGVDERAVRKALEAGRITLDDGTIDAAKADAAWRSAADPIKPHNLKLAAEPQQPQRRIAAKPVPTAALEAVRDALREAGRDIVESPTAGGITFVQAHAANEVMKAQERRVRLARLKGELVDKARATATVFALARRERDAWVQWPARAASLARTCLPWCYSTSLGSTSR